MDSSEQVFEISVLKFNCIFLLFCIHFLVVWSTFSSQNYPKCEFYRTSSDLTCQVNIVPITSSDICSTVSAI